MASSSEQRSGSAWPDVGWYYINANSRVGDNPLTLYIAIWATVNIKVLIGAALMSALESMFFFPIMLFWKALCISCTLYLSHNVAKCHIKSEIREKTTPIRHNSRFIFRSVLSQIPVCFSSSCMADKYCMRACKYTSKSICTRWHTQYNSVSGRFRC